MMEVGQSGVASNASSVEAASKRPRLVDRVSVSSFGRSRRMQSSIPNITCPFRHSVYRRPSPPRTVRSAGRPTSPLHRACPWQHSAPPTRSRVVKLLQNLQMVQHPPNFEGGRDAPTSILPGLRRTRNEGVRPRTPFATTQRPAVQTFKRS